MLDEIVGRAHELEELAQLVDDVASGPRAVVLVGEAGVGKTTLLETAVARAQQRGCAVLETRPVEAEARLSFAGLGDLLPTDVANVLDGLPAPQRRALSVALMLEEASGPPPETVAIAAALRSVILTLSKARPVVIAVDDVQWLDAPSAEALGFAIRRLETEPIAVVCAERRDRPGALPLGLDRARMPAELLPVGPLSIGALHRMLRTRLGASFSHPTLRRIEAASAGNPFLALEIARALQRRGAEAAAAALPVPETVSGLVEERLAELDSASLETLRIAALTANPTLDRILTVSEDAQALDAAVAGGFLTSEGGALRFAHPLFASVVAESTPPVRRRELHARLAADASDSEERARHLALAAAGPSEETAAEVESAAHEAISRGAPVTAAELFRLAAALTPEQRVESRTQRELAAADYLTISGDTSAARVFLERLVAGVAPGRLRAEALLRLARIREDDFAEADRLLTEALTEVRGESMLAAELHFVASDVTWALGDQLRAQNHAHRALEQAELLDEPALLASALVQVVWLDWSYGLPLDRERLERALELERTVDPLRLRASPSQVAGHALLAMGRLDEARTAFESALAQAESVGMQYWRTDVLYRLCLLEGRAGNLVRADELADESLATAEQLGLEQLESAVLFGRGLTHLLLGRAEEARRAAALGLSASRRVGEQRYALWNEWLLGFVDLTVGLKAEAAGRLGDLFERVIAQGDASLLRGMLPAIIEAHLAVGDTDAADAALAALEADRRDPVAAAQAERCRGAIAAARGDLASGVELLEAALRLHDETQLPLERVRTLLVLGGVQRRLKRRGAARASLREALRISEQIGAPLWAAQARAELGRVSGRAPGSGDLTESELRVAELVADGLTNKEAAAALFLSVRAVESTLSKVYGKLGVRSRTELAGKLRRPA